MSISQSPNYFQTENDLEHKQSQGKPRDFLLAKNDKIRLICLNLELKI
jgi:hypothetical protein